MDIKLRDDVITKNKLLLRLTFTWALMSSVSLLLVSMLSFNALKNKKTHWLPICTSSELSIGEADYSPSYLREMVKKVINLRLSYNPQTIESRYQTLLQLTPGERQADLRQLLNEEIGVVKEKNISSSFYDDNIQVDPKTHSAMVTGYLQRSSRGLAIKPIYKRYTLTFQFHHGELSPLSIREMENEKV